MSFKKTGKTVEIDTMDLCKSIDFDFLLSSWESRMRNEKFPIFEKPFERLPVKELIRALRDVMDYERQSNEYNEKTIETMFLDRFDAFSSEKDFNTCDVPEDVLEKFRAAFKKRVVNNWMEYFNYDVLLYRLTNERWDSPSVSREIKWFNGFDKKEVEEILQNSDGEDKWFYGIVTNARDLIKKIVDCDLKMVVDSRNAMLGTANIGKHDAYYMMMKKGNKIIFDVSEDYIIDTGEIGGVFRRTPWKFK